MLVEINQHFCKHQQNREYKEFGHSINDIVLDEGGKWFADCGEYATEIEFCPFCGIKLENHEKDNTKSEN